MIQEAKGAPQTAPVTPVKIQITSMTENAKKPHLTVHNTNTNFQPQSSDAKIKELEEKLAAMMKDVKEKVP